MLDRVAGALGERRVAQIHLVGDAAMCIARVAKEEHGDMIVMGSHGHGGLKSLLLGSVVSKTLALTRLPVLVVR